ncbi:MAG: hypothetical protein EPO31_02290 [Gammaproteobacteria bacterium]|nr:MAG: hypothetical protein EPO31_02290 [Gammaproteobacteria bacterium]
MNNRDYLIEMISDNQLDRRDVAEMLKVKRETVDRWLLSNEATQHEEVPDMAIELLRLKLKYRDQSRPDAAQ